MTTASLKPVRALIAVALAASVAWAMAGTVHWPIVGDAPLFHYIAFLMDHGKVPYRDIIDINMPGTYALEWAAIHVLGPGALAWRLFDFGLVAVCAAAMMAIAWPVDKLAGWFGGALFALLHFRDGPTHTGQRDLMMTALVMVACAAMFRCVRRRSVVDATICGFGAGMAAIVKPSGVLFATVLAGLWWWRASERGAASRLTPPSSNLNQSRFSLLAAIGFALPVMLCALWLWRHDALAAFVALNRGLVAYHASLGRPSFAALVVGSFPSVMLAVAVPAAVVFVKLRLWRSWGATVLIAGALVGAVSYVLQGKGFPYHRYPAEAFLSLGCGLVLVPAMRAAWSGAPPGLKPGFYCEEDVTAEAVTYRSWPKQETESSRLREADSFASLRKDKQKSRKGSHRLATSNALTGWVAIAGVLLGALYLAPVSAAIACHFDWRNQEFNHELAGDLNALGGQAALQQQVQCIDMTSGCLNTLYNLQIVQATGYLYDCYLFQSQQTPVSLGYREQFWTALEQARPRVLVVTDQQCFAMTRDWSGPARWPQFAALLASDYVLTKQYTPPHLVGWWRKPAVPYSYRLYVRKDDAPSQIH